MSASLRIVVADDERPARAFLVALIRSIEDAKVIVSDHHACSPDEALARLVFVSQHTNRRLRDIAHDVVTCAAGQGVEGASTPPVYRFTLKHKEAGAHRVQDRSQVLEPKMPGIS